jgi:hypothetical protein
VLLQRPGQDQTTPQVPDANGTIPINSYRDT